jgi:hypothetical protein
LRDKSGTKQRAIVVFLQQSCIKFAEQRSGLQFFRSPVDVFYVLRCPEDQTMPKRITLAMLTVGLLALTSGCGSSADLEVPQIAILSQRPEPGPALVCGQIEEQVYTLRGGDTLALDLLLSDNEALSQFKLDIHANFDCHGHARLNGDTETWSVLDLVDISGTETELPLRVVAPLNPSAGAYHFQLQVVDEAGNSEPSAYVYSILLRNPADTEAPTLGLVNPSPGANLSLPKGTLLIVSGLLADNAPLGSGGNAAVRLSHIREVSGNRITAAELSIPPGTGESYAFELEYTVPQTLVRGSYTFVLEAWDGVRNAATSVSWPVEITD